MHLEELPVSHISLLPVSTRKQLIDKLPITDVCQLEDTKFVRGIDMAAFWKSRCEELNIWSHDLVKRYFREWDDAEYYRSFLYGKLIAACTRLSIFEQIVGVDTIISPLYAVKKVFPPRHCQQSLCNSNVKEEVIEAVVNCFKGKLPKMFESYVYTYDDDDISFLSEIVYLGLKGEPFNGSGLKLVHSVLNVADKLQVLVLESHWCGSDDISVFLDDLCLLFSAHPTFLSTFQLLELRPGVDKFVVSRQIFDKFIMAYFSAATDHPQKLHFTNTKIKALEVPPSIDIDHRYLCFKNIELNDCKFVSSYKAKPTTISHWLGESICIEENADREFGSWLFQVKESIEGCPKKRKLSEIESDDSN